MVRAGPFPVLQLGLRHRRAEADVPQRRRLGLVRLPRARLRRNARWLVARAARPIVVYVNDQSTDSPSRRHNASNTCSSEAVSRSHSSTKLRREIAVGSARRASSTGASGGCQSGSYGNAGSHRTP
ncbi:hypothetical protein GCM10027605_64170 [Micromonospora zhanjiangensis]